MNRHGDGRKPLLADELTWPSSLGQTTHINGLDIGTTVVGQARNIAALLPMLGHYRRSLNLLSFDWFTWATAYDRNGGIFDFSGLFKYDSSGFTPEPVYGAFQRGALALEHCRRKGSTATVCARPA
jgi:hypothetical protein